MAIDNKTQLESSAYISIYPADTNITNLYGKKYVWKQEKKRADEFVN
jgi:hypothetical protein